jgi:hypothetical protein
MAWHYGTFSCGHEGRVNITGPTKNRDWIAEKKFSGLCPECYEKHLEEEREKANTEAAEKAKEMELPELTGSEKQVAWANTLRQKLIDTVENKIETFGTRKGGSLKLINEIFNYILTNKTEAKWFIDNRYDFENVENFFRKIKEEMPTEEKIIEEKTELEVKAECTVKPTNAATEIPAEIIIQEDKVLVKYEKDENFRLLVKSLGYKWDGIWVRNINSTTGSAKDRAAELGNKLLNAGFPITIMDEAIRNNAVKGIYEAECHRWIYLRNTGEYEGRLVIKWDGQNDKLYSIARKLPKNKWDNGVLVKVEHYKEVEEFAKLYEFKFSESALKSIYEYKKAMEKVEVVTPTVVEKESPKDGLQEILNSGSDILDDLKD